MNVLEGATSDHYSVLEPYNEHFAFTKYSSLIGAIELSGRDPDGLNANDHAALAAIKQSIYGKLNRKITITEYLIHYDGVVVKLKDRDNEKSHMLSKQREKYLNGKNLNASRIVHYLEIEPEDNPNKLNFPSFLKNLGGAIFEKRSRALIQNAIRNFLPDSISGEKMFLIEMEQMEHMRTQLQDAIAEVTQKWSGLFKARQLSLQEMWSHMKFLANLDPEQLPLGMLEEVPAEDMDICLSAGDIKPILVDKMDVVKLGGVSNVYAKFATVRRFSRKGGRVQPGLWAKDEKSPARIAGNYVLMTRWKPLSEFGRDFMFSRKNKELDRQTMNLFSMISGKDEASALEKQATMKPAIKAKLDELGIAEGLADVWGIGNSTICIFGSDPAKIKRTAVDMRAALSNASVHVTWESVSAADVYTAFQPGQGILSERNLNLTCSQFSAAGLIYQSNSGQETVPDLGGEEANYIFQSKDGCAFHYSPWVNGRAMTIGVGPIRKGKTWFKNTIATHQMKYGALYRAIDVDPGSEPIAESFGDDAGIIRVSHEPDGKTGANPFSSAEGENDIPFKIHLNSLLQLFLQTNDTESYRSIDADEQRSIDHAIDATLRLPPHLQTMSNLVAHMSDSLKMKFNRWVRPSDINGGSGAGWFAHLFDNEKDAIGALDKRMAVFNLQALKENPTIIKPVISDITYRIIRSFENPALRNIPKVLDIDEAHIPLDIPGFPEFLIKAIRTWGKWYASVQLWTQSVEELMKLNGWSALRSAASTFIFFSDPEMDEKLYRKAFPFLTAGECEAIRNLIPQKEAYIIQPDLNISKAVIIDVEPAQRVINTSNPREASLRDSLVKTYGFDEGISRAISELYPDERIDV
jgi:type IV secretion system protein VirB4